MPGFPEYKAGVLYCNPTIYDMRSGMRAEVRAFGTSPGLADRSSGFSVKERRKPVGLALGN